MPLALLLATALAAEPAYPPLAVDNAKFGARIQRSMRLLATSTPEKRNTVRVLFYGQSITEQKWAALVLADLKTRFPHADIVSENRAIAGYSSQLLVKTAEADLYPFQPDLLIFHVYGAHDKYEEIIRRTRERTCADILIQTDHVTKPADFTEETDAAKLPPAGKHWDAFMNHNWLPAVAEKYGCELCDQRTLWKQYLTANKLAPKALLTDSVHLNAHGEFLMAECVKAYLRYDPTLGEGYAAGRVTTYPAGDLKAVGNTLKLEFTGGRVDVVAKPGEKCVVRIDGKPPSAFPGAFRLTRAATKETHKFPVVAGIAHDKPPVAETWTLEMAKDPADEKRFTFTAKGSVTGPDGAGSTDKPFASDSGRVRIEPGDWNVGYAMSLSGNKTPPAKFAVSWRVEPTGRDEFADSPAVPKGVEPALTVAQGLPEGRHTLEIRGDVGRIEAVRVYRPGAGR